MQNRFPAGKTLTRCLLTEVRQGASSRNRKSAVVADGVFEYHSRHRKPFRPRAGAALDLASEDAAWPGSGKGETHSCARRWRRWTGAGTSTCARTEVEFRHDDRLPDACACLVFCVCAVLLRRRSILRARGRQPRTAADRAKSAAGSTMAWIARHRRLKEWLLLERSRKRQSTAARATCRLRSLIGAIGALTWRTLET